MKGSPLSSWSMLQLDAFLKSDLFIGNPLFQVPESSTI